MKNMIKSLAPFALFVGCSFSYADTLHNKTITGIFTNKGSLVAFKYEPVDAVSNPNNCDVSYLQLDSNAAFFKYQYATLMMAVASGKKVDINVGTACGYNLIVDWLYVHE